MGLGLDTATLRPCVAFPPGRSGVLVPRDDRRCAALGITMYTASKRHVLAAQWATWLWVRTIGPALLPGRTERVDIDYLPDICSGLGLPTDALTSAASYRRRDAVRAGATLVASGPGRAILVKVRPDDAGLRIEQNTLARVRAASPRTFRVPAPLGVGQLSDGRAWSAQEMVFSAPHRPCTSLPAGLAEELSRVLLGATDLQLGTNPSWRPAHGDLTAWNLRRDHQGQLWLFDWEDVCMAPPTADEAYFHGSLGLIRPRAPMPAVRADVADFWAGRIEARLADGHPGRENGIMLSRLREGARV